MKGRDIMAKNKQTGKTEVYPFWSMDDISKRRSKSETYIKKRKGYMKRWQEKLIK